MSTILTVLAVIAASPGLMISPAELAAALKEPAGAGSIVDWTRRKRPAKTGR